MTGSTRHAKLFAPCWSAEPGIVHLDYWHAGRPWIRLYVNQHNEIMYKTAGGLRTDWHGQALERHQFRPDRFFDLAAPERVHQILLLDFHSPYGFEHMLTLSQVAPFTWKGYHDVQRDDQIIVTLVRPGSYGYPDRGLHVGALPPVIPAPCHWPEQDGDADDGDYEIVNL